MYPDISTDNNVVARAGHGMIRPESRSRRGPQMSATPNSTLADPKQLIADLQRQLAECRAERDEALEQQTATAEVLQVINSSPGDLAPVFDAMLERALRLCDGDQGAVWLFEGDRGRVIASSGLPAEMVAELRRYEQPGVAPLPAMQRLLLGERVTQYSNLSDHASYHAGDPAFKAAVDLAHVGTVIWIALVKDGAAIGAFAISRREVRPFSEKQIALLQNFAAQAVIAMQNARLITETREALEQQTATAEVLQVINSSPGDLAPVFDAILEKAHRVCGAPIGSLVIRDGERFRALATRGYPEAYLALAPDGFPIRAIRSIARLLDGDRFVHVPDMTLVAEPSEHPIRSAAREIVGIRTALFVPLHKSGTVLGYISAQRREVRPFSGKEIALLENFAAQAVIAMENARLITETREALEQQTAAVEVLQVINSSPGDLAPVFDAMLERARRLCGAAFGELYIRDGERLIAAALQGIPEALAAYRVSNPTTTSRGTITGRISHGENVVHVLDLMAEEAYQTGNPQRRALVDLGGARTALAVGLRNEHGLLGLIMIYRQEVRAYTAQQIALLENFAAQAVIAMENARLLGELRERTRNLEESLEYQTATSEVLQVISRSAFDLQPVLQTLIETAARLCGAARGGIALQKGETYRYEVLWSYSPDWTSIAREMSFTRGRGTLIGRVLLEGGLVHIPDVAADQEYAVPGAQSGTLLGVPVLREDQPIGVLVLARQQIEPFTERQIELVRIFADQAVIAIENARLINETREALEQQTATAEVLQVINASPGDLAPVFDAILEKGMRVCEAEFGHLDIYDGKLFRTAAMRGVPAAYAEYRSQNPPFYGPGTGPARMLAGERIVHHLDMKEEEAYRAGETNRRALVDLGGARSALNVALVKDATFFGFMTLFRQQVRPFSDKQIALMESFAAQAVIAMDNARLLDEIRQRQAELRVTFENMGDGVAMFGADLRLAAWNRNFQQIIDLPEAVLAEQPTYADYLRILAERGEFGTDGIEA
jgi:GAF domain-containing protein